MRAPYEDQPNNTTMVYVDDEPYGYPVPGNSSDDETVMIHNVHTYRPGHTYFERLVFGNGRVALRFRTRRDS